MAPRSIALWIGCHRHQVDRQPALAVGSAVGAADDDADHHDHHRAAAGAGDDVRSDHHRASHHDLLLTRCHGRLTCSATVEPMVR
jgi:hypothetical protein